MHAIPLQWALVRGDPAANMGIASAILADARPDPGDIVLLPELWPTGYTSRARLVTLATEYGPRWLSFCAEVAARYRIVLAGTLPYADGETLWNRLTVHGPRGDLLGSYDKVHLFSLMREHELFSPGTRVEPIPLGNGFVVGPAICYDLRFPELFRLGALRGATLFLVPSEFPDPKEDLWHIFLSSRAAENQAYLIASNRTGGSGSFTFFGSSAVYDPLGRCLGRLGREEGFLKVETDPAMVTHVRMAVPVLPHARLRITEPAE